MQCQLMNENSPNHDGALSDLTDQSLVRRFRDGEDDAATALYLRYAGRLVKLADRQVYDDVALQADREGIVQSVFRTFFRRASSGQYEALSGDDLWRLMLAIALNKIRSTGTWHRAARRNVSRTRPLTNQAGMEQPLAHDHEMPVVHLRLTIDELLEQIPAENRRIILLRIDGFEVTDIAQQTGRAKRSVERILQKFRQQLESALAAEN